MKHDGTGVVGSAMLIVLGATLKKLLQDESVAKMLTSLSGDAQVAALLDAAKRWIKS